MTVSFISGGNWSSRRKPRPVANHRQILSHNVVSTKTSPLVAFELTTLVMIGTNLPNY